MIEIINYLMNDNVVITFVIIIGIAYILGVIVGYLGCYWNLRSKYVRLFCLNQKCKYWKQVDKNPDVDRGRCNLLLNTIYGDLTSINGGESYCLGKREKE